MRFQILRQIGLGVELHDVGGDEIIRHGDPGRHIGLGHPPAPSHQGVLFKIKAERPNPAGKLPVVEDGQAVIAVEDEESRSVAEDRAEAFVRQGRVPHAFGAFPG